MEIHHNGVEHKGHFVQLDKSGKVVGVSEKLQVTDDIKINGRKKGEAAQTVEVGNGSKGENFEQIDEKEFLRIRSKGKK